ncbi:hypothetical protein B0H17DRAFT_845773, partial [Mycena rosella]
LAAAAVPAFASNITAWSGFNCAGTTLVVPCDGSCHSFNGRNSFSTVAGTEHCVAMFTGRACNSSDFAFTNPNQAGECTNIESSETLLSFTCSADNTCTV